MKRRGERRGVAVSGDLHRKEKKKGRGREKGRRGGGSAFGERRRR